MPIYQYRCRDCGDFQAMKTIADRNSPEICPSCGVIARRIVLAPNLAVMNATVRRATAINEKSRHEPKVRESHSCGSGCGCGPKSTKIRPDRKRETGVGVLA